MVVAQQINHLEEKNFIDTRDEIAAEDVTESNIFTDNEVGKNYQPISDITMLQELSIKETHRTLVEPSYQPLI